MRLVKSISGFVLVLRISRYGRGIISKRITGRKGCAAVFEKTLLQAFIKKVMVYILSDPIFIGKGMVILPCQDAREGLPVSGKEVPGQGYNLLCGGQISGRVYRIINTRCGAYMSDDVHHSNMVSFRRYNLRFCIRNRVFAPFWPGRHWNFRAFWNFSDQLGAEHFCVFFLRVINRSALKNVGISILLRLFNDGSFDLAGWFCWHNMLLFI